MQAIKMLGFFNMCPTLQNLISHHFFADLQCINICKAYEDMLSVQYNVEGVRVSPTEGLFVILWCVCPSNEMKY